MIPRLAQTWGSAVVMLGVLATRADAATMTCTQEQQTVLSSPMAGQAIRKDCVMAKGADGHGQLRLFAWCELLLVQARGQAATAAIHFEDFHALRTGVCEVKLVPHGRAAAYLAKVGDGL